MAFGFSWLKPELDTPKYWVHLFILSLVSQIVLQFLFGGEMLTIFNVLVSIPILALADLVAHTLLQLD